MSDGADTTEQRTRWDGREWAAVAERYYDPTSDDELASFVVLALADAQSIAPSEVTDPVLTDCVDVEALTRFVTETSPSSAGKPENATRFTYDDLLVSVSADGHVVVFEPTE